MHNRKIQIGVIGSAMDLGYDETLIKVARELGKEIALSGQILSCGAEIHCDTLATQSAISAKENNGIVMGFSTGKNRNFFNKDLQFDVLVCTGLELGGGREFCFINSCDAIISIAGGVGTLTEMAIAYQSNIPIFALINTGGTSDQMAGKFFDKRNIQIVQPCLDSKDAVNKILTHFNK